MIIIMLCSQQTSEFLINAMRVGVREVLPSPPGKEALEAAVSRARIEVGSAERPAERTHPGIRFLQRRKRVDIPGDQSRSSAGAEGKKVLLIDLNLAIR
jgi:pilus assembly protein CpaE